MFLIVQINWLVIDSLFIVICLGCRIYCAMLCSFLQRQRWEIASVPKGYVDQPTRWTNCASSSSWMGSTWTVVLLFLENYITISLNHSMVLYTTKKSLGSSDYSRLVFFNAYWFSGRTIHEKICRRNWRRNSMSPRVLGFFSAIEFQMSCCGSDQQLSVSSLESDNLRLLRILPENLPEQLMSSLS